MVFCNVIIANSSQSFSGKLNFLTYSIPEELNNKIHIGSFVIVPFGKEFINALVIDIHDKAPENTNFKIKAIEDIIQNEKIYQTELVELIKFTAEHYACNYEDVLNAALPKSAIKKPEQEIKLLSEDANDPVLSALAKARGQKAKFTRLKTLSKLGKKELQKKINQLEKQGKIAIDYIINAKKNKQSKNPLDRLRDLDPSLMPDLNQEQETALNFIKEHADNKAQKFLLHGVTGSGKTEIYLRLITENFKKNQSTIVLVPEISLAPQIVERIAQRFGRENVLIWHSALNESEKQHSWDEIISGEPKVIVGARSGIWAPVKNLGLIIIDEEHENSYKQESPSPRYHARTVAIKRAELNNCPIVLGSATPSLELYYKASSEHDNLTDYHLVELKKRVFDTPMPAVHVVDMRDEFLKGNKSIFSRSLKQQIEEALANEEQVILFLNRRGSSSHVFCRTCGYVYECDHCESKMIYHEDVKLLICHHCGAKSAHPEECPECNMSTIKFFGLGTQKLENEAKRVFKEARIARLDSDTSKQKHQYLKVWQDFKDGKIDILIGTQMIAKGFDIPKLSTVGVISADTSFSQLDYQAEERGFQLLTQVAGRAGRREKEGRVIFQTYQPERHILETAKEQDYQKFFATEISNRQELDYPPFSTLVRLVSSSENMADAVETANKFQELAYQIDNIQILGPSPCAIPKLRSRYRQHLLIKIPRDTKISINNDQKYQEALAKVKETFQSFKAKQNTNFSIDVENINLY